MKHLFIINPAAGSRDQTRHYSEQIRKSCAVKNIECDIQISAAPGDCSRIARQPAETGANYRI
jgi:diacylglycerol kinase family enzyme